MHSTLRNNRSHRRYGWIVPIRSHHDLHICVDCGNVRACSRFEETSVVVVIYIGEVLRIVVQRTVVLCLLFGAEPPQNTFNVFNVLHTYIVRYRLRVWFVLHPLLP